MNEELEYQKYLSDGGEASFEDYKSFKEFESMLPTETDSEKKKTLPENLIVENTTPSSMMTSLPISNELDLNQAQEKSILQAQADNSLGLDSTASNTLLESPSTETVSSGLESSNTQLPITNIQPDLSNTNQVNAIVPKTTQTISPKKLLGVDEEEKPQTTNDDFLQLQPNEVLDTIDYKKLKDIKLEVITSGAFEGENSIGGLITKEQELSQYQNWQSNGWGKILPDEKNGRPQFQVNEVGQNPIQELLGYKKPDAYDQRDATNKSIAPILQGAEAENRLKEQQESVLGEEYIQQNGVLTRDEFQEAKYQNLLQDYIKQGNPEDQAVALANQTIADDNQSKSNTAKQYINSILQRGKFVNDQFEGKAKEDAALTQSEVQGWNKVLTNYSQDFSDYLNDRGYNKFGEVGDYNFELESGKANGRRRILDDFFNWKKQNLSDYSVVLKNRDESNKILINDAVKKKDVAELQRLRELRNNTSIAKINEEIALFKKVNQDEISINQDFDVTEKKKMDAAREYAGYENSEFTDTISYTSKAIGTGIFKVAADVVLAPFALASPISKTTTQLNETINAEVQNPFNVLQSGWSDTVNVYKDEKTGKEYEERFGFVYDKDKSGDLKLNEKLTYDGISGLKKTETYQDRNIASISGTIVNMTATMMAADGIANVVKAGTSSKLLGWGNKSAQTLGKENILTKALYNGAEAAQSYNKSSALAWSYITARQNMQTAQEAGLSPTQAFAYTVFQSAATGLMTRVSPDNIFFKEYSSTNKSLFKLLSQNKIEEGRLIVTDFLKKYAKTAIGENTQEFSEQVVQDVVNEGFNSINEKDNDGKDKFTASSIDDYFAIGEQTSGYTFILNAFNALGRGKIRTSGMNNLEKAIVASQIPEAKKMLYDLSDQSLIGYTFEKAGTMLNQIKEVEKYTSQIPDGVSLSVSQTADVVIKLQQAEALKEKIKENGDSAVNGVIQAQLDEVNKSVDDILKSGLENTKNKKYDLNAKIGEDLITTETTSTNEENPQSPQESEAVQAETNVAETQPNSQNLENSTYTDKEGKNYTINQYGKDPANGIMVTVQDGDKVIGMSNFTQKKDGTISSESTSVQPEYRRKGLASAMYDHLTKQGIKLSPAPDQKADGKNFTDNYFNRILNPTNTVNDAVNDAPNPTPETEISEEELTKNNLEKLKLLQNGNTETTRNNPINDGNAQLGTERLSETQQQGKTNTEGISTAVNTDTSKGNDAVTNNTDAVKIPSSNGKYNIQENKDQSGNTTFQLLDKNGKEVNPKSYKTKAEYVAEVINQKEYPESKVEIQDGMTEADYTAEVLEKSENPKEIAQVLMTTPKFDKGDVVGSKKWVIAQVIGKNVNRDSFIRFGDVNNITDPIARTYFPPQKGGKGIDVIAQEASEMFNQDYSSEAITPQDIVDFIMEFPGDPTKAERPNNPTYTKAEAKFIKLTGERPSKYLLDKLNPSVAKTIESTESQKQKALAEYERLDNVERNKLVIEYDSSFNSLPLEQQISEYEYNRSDEENGDETATEPSNGQRESNPNAGNKTGTNGTVQRQQTNERYAQITKQAFDALIEQLKKPFAKAFKNLNITTDWNAFSTKAKALGLNVNFDSQFQIQNPKPLIVIHNISERGLANALNIGGLPVPSLAITSANNPLTSFGEITLIGDTYLADPKQPTNKVFDTDVYSPRYPRSEKSFKSISDQTKFEKEILDLANQDEKSKFTYLDVEDALNEMRSSQIMTAYMVDNNIKFPDSKYGNGASEYFYNTDGAEQALQDWVEEKTAKYNIEDKIFNGYTPSGYRKYIPHNLENVVKILKGKIKNGENFTYGAGNIRASASKQFKNLEDIKKDRNKIVSKKEIENLKDETQDELSDLLVNIKDNYRYDKNSFSYFDEAAASIGEFAGGKKNALNETFENLSEEQLNTIKEYILKLKNAPTEYFEAKPQRAVALREFKAAVVPKGISDKFLSELNKRGLAVYQYDKKIEGDRQQKVNEASSEQDVQFMRTVNGEIYGAKLPDGTIYINPEKLNANTAIHEFSHLWEQVMPNAWKKGVALFQNTKTGKELYTQLKSDGNYSTLSYEQIWSEALNTHIGNYGEWRNNNPRGKMKELSDWIKNVFSRIGNYFNIKANPETTLKVFTESVVGDLLGGKAIAAEVNADGNTSINYNIVNSNNLIPAKTINEVIEEIQTNGLESGVNKLKESNWYKNLSAAKKQEINTQNLFSENNIVATLIQNEQSRTELAKEIDKVKLAKEKESSKEAIKDLKQVAKEKIAEIKAKYVEEIQKIKFGSKAESRERIAKIRNIQKQAYNDIVNLITSDKIKRSLTPSEANRLIKATANILNANNTQKALDNFIELYNKTNAYEYQKQLENDVKYTEKITQEVKDGFADGKTLQEIYDINPKKYESPRAKDLARKVYDREVSKTKPDDNAYKKVKERQQQVKDALYKFPKLKEVIQNIKRGFIREVSDRQYLPKTILKNINAKATYNRMISYGGASASAKARWEKIYDKIFADMTNKDRDNFNAIVQQRRIVSVDQNRESRGLEPVNHPDNSNQYTAQNALKQMELEIGKPTFDKLNKKADDYFAEFKGLLSDMKKNGIINQEQYDSMADVDYQPRQFMEHLFDMEYDNDGKLISVRPLSGEKFGDSTGLSKDQIRSLEEGSMGILMDDAQLLLATAVGGRTKSFFMNNVNSTFINKDFPQAKTKYETLKSKVASELTSEDKRFLKYFAELQTMVKENPMVGLTPSGKPKFLNEELPSKGWKRAYYFENGIRKEFFMRDDFYDQWHDTMKKFADSDVKEAISVVSGSAVTKMMATGRNPGFALVNTPRDFASVMLFSEEYSNIAPLSLIQLAKDSTKAIGEIFKYNNTEKDNLLSKYLEYGGGMDFLNAQGESPILARLADWGLRLVNKGDGINNKTKNTAGKWFDIATLKSLSQYSETMFRVAVFDRSIQNQLKAFSAKSISDLDQETQDNVYTQAVVSARKVMDFNQGGRSVKALESVIPYINAATQGTRVAVDSVRERPYATTARFLQGATATASLGYAISMALISAFKDDDDERSADEIYLDIKDGLSPFQKRGYIQFINGKKNEDREYTTYKIAVTQPLTPFFTLASNIFDDIIRAKVGRKTKGIGYAFDEFREAFSANVDPFGISDPTKIATKNPIIKALATYASGYDFFRDEQLDGSINKSTLQNEGYKNKKVEDFYKAWGQETGMSPIRTKAAIEAMITSPDTNPFIAMTYGSIDKMVGYDSGFNEKKGFVQTISGGFEKRLTAETSDFGRLSSQLTNDDRKAVNKIASQEELIDFEADKIILKFKDPILSQQTSVGLEIGKLINNKNISPIKKAELAKKVIDKYVDIQTNGKSDPKIFYIKYETHQSANAQAEAIIRMYGKEFIKDPKAMQSLMMNKVLSDNVWMSLMQNYKIQQPNN